MAGNLSRPLTLQQKGLLNAIRAAGGGLTTHKLVRLRIYANGSATITAVRGSRLAVS